MEPTGSTPYKPAPATTNDEELEEVIVHEDDLPQLPSNVPVYVMVAAVTVLVITLGVIGFLVTRGTSEPEPEPTAEPTGVPVLPVRVGDYARDPGDRRTAPDFGIDRSIQTSSADYLKNGQVAYLVVGARPVTNTRDLLERQIKVSAIREVNGAVCGRDKTELDICAVRRNQTTVLAIGMRQQEITEIVDFARQVLTDTK